MSDTGSQEPFCTLKMHMELCYITADNETIMQGAAREMRQDPLQASENHSFGRSARLRSCHDLLMDNDTLVLNASYALHDAPTSMGRGETPVGCRQQPSALFLMKEVVCIGKQKEYAGDHPHAQDGGTDE